MCGAMVELRLAGAIRVLRGKHNRDLIWPTQGLHREPQLHLLILNAVGRSEDPSAAQHGPATHMITVVLQGNLRTQKLIIIIA
jgi:hypothetical protein